VICYLVFNIIEELFNYYIGDTDVTISLSRNANFIMEGGSVAAFPNYRANYLVFKSILSYNFL